MGVGESIGDGSSSVNDIIVASDSSRWNERSMAAVDMVAKF